MKINRATVKQQAKDIIRGNVFKLFIISLIVGALAGGGTSYSASNADFDELFDRDTSSYEDRFEQDPFGFDEGATEYDENFFNEFDGNGKITLSTAGMDVAKGAAMGALTFAGLLSVILALVLGPLRIMLDGLYWQLIKGNNMSFGDGLTFVFKKTFDKNYLQKFLLNLVQGILLGLLYICFIIPGVIFTYKWYFTSYIMAENPELSFEQAMNTSKKMTNNHKGELFVMDLSFIPWYLLMIPTIGLVSIYVIPYVSTTKALYYENFKIRAFQEGAITEFDFMPSSQQAAVPQYQTPAQPMNAYTPVPQQETYYTPAVPQAPEQNGYYQPAAPVAPVAPPQPVPPPEPMAQPVAEEPVAFEAPAAEEAPSDEYYTPTEPTQENE